MIVKCNSFFFHNPAFREKKIAFPAETGAAPFDLFQRRGGPTFRAAKSSKSRWGAAECSPPVPLASQAACVSGGTRGPPPPACGVALAPPVRRIPLISAFSGRDPPHSRRTMPSNVRAPPQPGQAAPAGAEGKRMRRNGRPQKGTHFYAAKPRNPQKRRCEGWRGDRKAPPRARRRETLGAAIPRSRRNGWPRRVEGRPQSPLLARRSGRNPGQAISRRSKKRNPQGLGP